MKVSDRVAVTRTPTYSIIHDTCEAGKGPCRVICKKTRAEAGPERVERGPEGQGGALTRGRRKLRLRSPLSSVCSVSVPKSTCIRLWWPGGGIDGPASLAEGDGGPRDARSEIFSVRAVRAQAAKTPAASYAPHGPAIGLAPSTQQRPILFSMVIAEMSKPLAVTVYRRRPRASLLCSSLLCISARSCSPT
jgi:hypothetical protein